MIVAASRRADAAGAADERELAERQPPRPRTAIPTAATRTKTIPTSEERIAIGHACVAVAIEVLLVPVSAGDVELTRALERSDAIVNLAGSPVIRR